MLMDLMIKKITNGQHSFDKNGERASRGIPNLGCVDHWLEHPYFSKAPPKSSGREIFGEIFFKELEKDLKGFSPEDKMATIVELTAASLAQSYHRYLPQIPKRTFICGGGAENRYLKYRIQYNLPETKVETTSSLGWPAQSVEGGAFALLAALRYWGQKGHYPVTTGASRQVLLGKICEL